MSLTRETRDYEILIRFNEDGSLGAQSQRIVEIKEGGEVVSAAIEPPVPLTLDELKTLVAGLENGE